MTLLRAQDINSRQNDTHHLRLLKAADVAHARAGRVESARWASAAALSGIGFVSLGFPSIAPFASLIGIGGAVLTEFIWPALSQSFTRTAAIIQEMFDSSLFNLRWNDDAGDPLPLAHIADLGRTYASDHPKSDWYMDVRGVPSPLAELHCQRENLLWDSDIRQEWAWRLTALTFGGLFLAVTVSLIGELTVFQLLAWLLAPAAPLLAAAIHAIRQNRAIASGKGDLRIALDRLLFGLTPENISDADVAHLQMQSREIQNRLFEMRCVSTRVPQRFYDNRLDRYENNHRLESRTVRSLWAHE